MTAFTDIIENSNSAEEACSLMFLESDNNPVLRRKLYVWYPVLVMRKFGKQATMIALNDCALWDVSSENKIIRRAARSFEARFALWRNLPQFYRQMKTTGIAGFVSKNMLQVVHKCVKPNSLTYQVTTFIEGIGPVGDTQYDSIKKIIKDGEVGITAMFVDFEQLQKIECKFLPKVA